MCILALFFLVILLIIIFISFNKVQINGRNWSRWNSKRKSDFITRYLSGLKRTGNDVKNPPLYYLKEIDRFYMREDKNLNYNITNVIANLVKLYG